MDQSNHRYEVLVIDDSPVYRKIMERVVVTDEYTLSFAADGAEAIRLYEERSPCIVITDWILPDICGLELCRRIRADRKQQYTYIIMMTSNTEKANVVKGLEAGADDYLIKPFDSDEMLARIGVGRRIVDLNRQLAAKTDELERMARTDSLTGIPNRRAVEEWAEKQLRGATRHGFSLWLVLTDLDHFKRINDRFGHNAGDIALKTFASVLQKNTRACDMCGRLGGDEFVLVITHVETGAITQTIERFREQLSALPISLEGEGIVRVTASFGVSGTNPHRQGGFQGFKELLRKADQMLYEAKRAGGNTVRVASD